MTLKPQGPKLVRDRLLDLMSDSGFHSAHEMEQLLPHGEWIRAMKELLAISFCFERLSNSFRIRRRLSSERKQILVELLAGIDATRPEAPSTIEEEKMSADDQPVIEPESPEEPEEEFDPTAEIEDVPEEEGKLVLSGKASEISLSANTSATMTAAILAKKGSGKTYLGMVLAEELILCPGLKVPVVVIDPTGVWYGLRSNEDGTPSSLPMITLGGPHGDVEINCGQGASVAQLVIDIRPMSVILDLSLMIPSEQHEFVADFGQKLFVLSTRLPLHLIIDEADEFAPQYLSTSKHQKRSLEVLDRIVRRGRIKGLGVTLITQRSAVIAKNVISQIDSLFLLNMGSPTDLEAVDAWMRHSVRTDQRIECLGQLPNLPPGTAYYLQGGTESRFRRFVVRKRLTFDSSRTPKPNEVIVVPTFSPIPIDIMDRAKKLLMLSEPQPNERSDGEDRV